MTDKTLPIIARPLSPHLSIYKPQMTSMLSILHRITGVALVVGTALLVAWLWAAAYAPDCYVSMHNFFVNIIGELLLMGWTFAFYYHFCNGIRHLIWDTGNGFEIHVAQRLGMIVLLATFVLTIGTWVLAFYSSGAVQ